MSLTKDHQEIVEREGLHFLTGYMEGEISTLNSRIRQLARKVDEQQKRILDLECENDSLLDALEGAGR